MVCYILLKNKTPWIQNFVVEAHMEWPIVIIHVIKCRSPHTPLWLDIIMEKLKDLLNKPWHTFARGIFIVLRECLSTSCHLVYVSKVRHYYNIAACRLLLILICIVWNSLRAFHLGDMALFACHNDWRLGSFSIKRILKVIDTTTNGTVFEPQDRREDCLSIIIATFFDYIGF